MKQITMDQASEVLKTSGVQAKVFYSSWLGGWTEDLRLMQVPLDDHIVHRGDGVFEAFRFCNGKFYLLEPHLNRLSRSMEALGLNPPMGNSDLKKLLHDLVEKAGPGEWLVRLFVSRGPGGFTTNPYESVGSQLYIAVTKFVPVAAEKYSSGVAIDFSNVSVKEGLWSQVKSCNYLPNVMMKKEAVDRKVDFVIGVDSQGFITESSTENLSWIDSQGNFCHPPFKNILRGTTLERLAQLVSQNNLMPVQVKSCSKSELTQAQALFMVGTTLNVLGVKSLGGTLLGASKWWKDLNNLILQDQQ